MQNAEGEQKLVLLTDPGFAVTNDQPIFVAFARLKKEDV